MDYRTHFHKFSNPPQCVGEVWSCWNCEADYVVIEPISDYCPACQNKAPTDGASDNLRGWLIAAAVTFLGVLALFVALVIYCGGK